MTRSPVNTFDAPENIVPAALTVSVEGGGVVLKLPAQAVAAAEIRNALSREAAAGAVAQAGAEGGNPRPTPMTRGAAITPHKVYRIKNTRLSFSISVFGE